MHLVVTIHAGRVSPVFEGCATLRVVTLDGVRVQGHRDLPLPGRGCTFLVGRLVDLEARTLICGGISRRAAAMVEALDIELLAWVAGPVDQVIEAWLAGRLPDPAFSLPGCGSGRGGGRCRAGRGRRQRGGNHAGFERKGSPGRRPPDR